MNNNETTRLVSVVSNKMGDAYPVYKCEQCGAKVLRYNYSGEIKYCSQCGRKIDYGENNE